MQFLQINAKNTHFLFNIPQIKILPQYPGSQDPNVLWTLVGFTEVYSNLTELLLVGTFI